jgi:hypothetical protein
MTAKTKELKMTDRELSFVNQITTEEELCRVRIEKLKAEVSVLLLKQRLLAHEIKDKNLEVVEAQGEAQRKSEERREALKVIEKKHKLAAGWGYDPLSGELKEA